MCIAYCTKIPKTQSGHVGIMDTRFYIPHQLSLQHGGSVGWAQNRDKRELESNPVSVNYPVLGMRG